MDSEPRFLGVSMLGGGKTIYLVAVKSKNVPGALGDIATRIGKAGLNILTASDCSLPEAEDSAVSFFLEPREGEHSEEEVRKAVATSPFVTDVNVRTSSSKLMVDDLGFPVMYFPSGRAVIFPQRGIVAMFRDVIRMFGTGGESILFRAGYSVGTQGTNDLAKAVGDEDLQAHTESFTSLFSALGWGRLEMVGGAEDLSSIRLRLEDGFESDGVKSSKPACHFTRGMVAGSAERIFGESVTCEEAMCEAAGDPYCEFTVSRRIGSSKSGSSGS